MDGFSIIEIIEGEKDSYLFPLSQKRLMGNSKYTYLMSKECMQGIHRWHGSKLNENEKNCRHIIHVKWWKVASGIKRDTLINVLMAGQ